MIYEIEVLRAFAEEIRGENASSIDQVAAISGVLMGVDEDGITRWRDGILLGLVLAMRNPQWATRIVADATARLEMTMPGWVDALPGVLPVEAAS